MRIALVKFGDAVNELEASGGEAPDFEGGNRYVRDFIAATEGDERLLLSLWEYDARSTSGPTRARTIRIAPATRALPRALALGRALVAAFGELLRFRPGVIVCLDTGPPAGMCLDAAWLTGARLVVVATTDPSGTGRGGRLRAGLARSLVRSGRTRAVLACAKGVKRRLVELAGARYEGAVRVYHPDYRAMAGRLPATGRERPRDVLFVGRLAAVKGASDLAQVAGRIAEAGGRLVIVGEGPEEASLREATSGLGGSVEFAGVLPHGQVMTRMSQSRVVVMPSRSEGVAKVALESILAGTPVVGYAVGGIAEAVEDGVTGALVAPGDAVGLGEACARLLGDDASWGAMVDSALVERERIVSRHPTFGQALAECLGPLREGSR